MHRALNIATEIMNTFKTGDQDSVIACRKIAQKFMGDKVDSAAVYKSDLKPIVFATGHCHIGSCFSRYITIDEIYTNGFRLLLALAIRRDKA